ncbi:MAG: hypothetical protein JXR48_00285 [Candidatus Delongbacteria bacterium]|nr:hypothetical protein [Candidatus Delongbacteria bacterium]MBN2833381.1 hypothetical protein [Candidatus Delongbacteria bacterium]
MKILVIILVLTGLLVAEPVKIKNFDELMDAFKGGYQVRAVIDYGKCKLVSDNEEKKSPKAIGGINVDAWEYFEEMAIGNPQAFVVFSTAKLINYRGWIYNYAKFKVTAENKVIMTAQYADTKTFEVDMDEKFFTDINDGDNDGACNFYYEK